MHIFTVIKLHLLCAQNWGGPNFFKKGTHFSQKRRPKGDLFQTKRGPHSFVGPFTAGNVNICILQPENLINFQGIPWGLLDLGVMLPPEEGNYGRWGGIAPWAFRNLNSAFRDTFWRKGDLLQEKGTFFKKRGPKEDPFGPKGPLRGPGSPLGDPFGHTAKPLDPLTDWLTDNLKSRDASASKNYQILAPWDTSIKQMVNQRKVSLKKRI